MLIRKNTKAFKTILEIIEKCQGRSDRERLVRLFITRPGHTIKDRISIEGIQGDAALFYEMNYQTILNSLKSPMHQLHASEEVDGIFFFHSTSNKLWEETPFEFDEAIKQEFASLPELPVTRKREKPQKITLPTAGSKQKSSPVRQKKEETKPERKSAPKKKAPLYKLKHQIEFTSIDRILFRQPEVSKKDVLDYYEKMSGYILPYLKGRPIAVRQHSGSGPGRMITTAEKLFEDNHDQQPNWFQTFGASKRKEHPLMCNDKEHMMLYVEMGAIEFHSYHAKVTSPERPDYIIIGFESAETEPEKLTHVLLAAKQILTGLKLPSFPKTDGLSGYHVYIPLDTKSNFKEARSVAEFICNLIRLKITDGVAIKEPDRYGYGKVILDHSLNLPEQCVVAPYSMIGSESPAVSIAFSWNEMEKGMGFDGYSPGKTLERMKKTGDHFSNMSRKKINTANLLSRLEENYGFLV